jgi:hypothetical protein
MGAGFAPLAYDDGVSVERSMPGYDPSLWYLAEVDGAAAAGMILSRRVQEDDALYVEESRHWRSTGAAGSPPVQRGDGRVGHPAGGGVRGVVVRGRGRAAGDRRRDGRRSGGLARSAG